MRHRFPSVLLVLASVACVRAAAPRATATPVRSSPAPVSWSSSSSPPPASGSNDGDSFALAWRVPFDTQSALLLHDRTIFESGWHGIFQYGAGDGREVVHFAGSDETFRAWIGVDAAHDPVLIDLGGFILGRDRRARLARFEASVAEPRWISSACSRLYAAALSNGEIVALCGSGTTPPAPFPPGSLVILDAATGRERTRMPIPGTSPFEEHALVVAHGVVALRDGDHVMLFDGGARPRRIADRVAQNSFGLAATDRGFAFAENGSGLVEIDAASGRDVRRIEMTIRGTPDPFTSRLGRLLVHGETAYVEAGGAIHAIDLREGRERWRAPGGDSVADDDRVYACRGNHFVALDASTGALRFSYSTGTCDILGASGSRVFVRYEALPPRSGAADMVWAGILAFDRRAGSPAPCERAVVRGEVRINGRVASEIDVRAGNAWAAESNGVVHMWGGPMTPTDEHAAATARTDSAGRYSLTICERGHVPVVVDPEQARRFAREAEVDDISAYVHLDGRGAYTVDFAISAHGPTP